MSTPQIPGAVWSATPTPLTIDFRIDLPSLARTVEHHLAMKVSGVMLGGTCGEGLWLRDSDREALTRSAIEASGGKMRVALQVTDNSALRVLDAIERATAWGLDLAVVATPPFYPDATPGRIVAMLREVISKSPIPVGFYDLGRSATYPVSDELLPELLAEPNLVMVKDSSGSPARSAIHLEARRRRPGLVLFNGNEFECLRYIRLGYDGLLLGGAVFNARIAHGILEAERTGRSAEAERLDRLIVELCYCVYGGPEAACWLAGLKMLLVEMGVFSSRLEIYGYPLTEACLNAIQAAVSGSDGKGFRPYLLGRE
jgi:4-hydroxy-tetrahydrodipicolinate synthase